MAQGRHREAGDAFDAAARLDPRFVLAWINGGNAAARAGRLRGAEERYRKALEIAPRNGSRAATSRRSGARSGVKGSSTSR